jgi:hypothetical protein
MADRASVATSATEQATVDGDRTTDAGSDRNTETNPT